MLPIQFGEARFEIIVHHHDRQFGFAGDDANAELRQCGAKFLCALHIDRLNTHAVFLEILLGRFRRNSEACPVRTCRARRRTGFRNDVAAFDQALKRFIDCVGWIFLPEIAGDPPKAFSGADGVRDRTIQFAVKKELPILGIEAYDIRRQNVNGEMRRELRSDFAIELRRAVAAITRDGTGTGGPRLLAASVNRHSRANIREVVLRQKRVRTLVRRHSPDSRPFTW